jgi:hypothetical protein
MKILGFGQPVGSIIQQSYVVEDIDASIAHWAEALRVGPFFLARGWKGENPVFRGRPSDAAVSIAMGFAGHMQIELIQPEDDRPSVYNEFVARKGYGFHHSAFACEDLDAEIARFEARGMQEVFRVGVPTGGVVAYMEGSANLPGLIELLPVNPVMDVAFTEMWRASIDWDGTNPVREL